MFKKIKLRLFKINIFWHFWKFELNKNLFCILFDEKYTHVFS